MTPVPRTSLLELADAGPATASMRYDEPVWRCELTGIWVVESYTLVREVLGRPEDFSSKTSLSLLDATFPAREVEAVYRDAGCGWARTLQTNDPPGHRRFRTLVDRVFAASRVEALAPTITRVVAELLEEWPAGRPFDAVGGFAAPLPLRIIADELGVPRADAPCFKRWSDAALRAIGLGATRQEHLDAAHAGVEFQRYFTPILADPERQPHGSLVARVAAAAADPDVSLTLSEQLSLLHTLMIAGHETTASTLGSVLLQLALDPALGDAVRADEAVAKRLIEDVLRLYAPVQGLFRVTTRATGLGGVALAPRTVVCVRLGAANRDPARFAENSLLSQTTSSSAHLSFGAGLHHCVGAPLARRELAIAIDGLLVRFSRLELRCLPAELRYTRSVMTRGLVALPLTGVPHGT